MKATDAEPVLMVQGLSISFASYLGQAKVLDNVGFRLQEGELLGLAGEQSARPDDSLAVFEMRA